MSNASGPVSIAGLSAFLLMAGPALAQPSPAEQQQPIPHPGEQAGPSLWARDKLLGDMGGLRPELERYGITLGLTNSAELFASAAGGIKHGISGDGLATLTIGVDGEKAFGWAGAKFNASVLGIYGPNFSQGYLGNLQTASGIVAAPTVRLWELWYQQEFLGGKADVRLGLMSLDQEFMASEGSALFLNTVMGWPMLPSADLYAGGPAYPLSSLGIRLRARPAENLTVLAAVVQDNPPGGPFENDGQLRGPTRYGANFDMRTGALMIAEVQYAVNQAEGDEKKASSGGLPGTYKLGAWFDTASFPDQRYDNSGLSLAAPASTGTPLMHRHNYSLYAVADQTIWQAGGEDKRAVSVFLRPMFAPADRNLIDFSVNGGVTMKAPLPGRDEDTAGIGFGVANVSNRVAGLDRDRFLFGGDYVPMRGAETFVELTYQIQVTPWLQVQPDFQYFWMPGGGVVNPADPTRRIGNEAVFGIRTNITL